jgi:hypothetical protein
MPKKTKTIYEPGDNEVADARVERVETYLEKNFGVRSIKEILVDYTLLPPIYGDHITTLADRAERTIKLVSGIERVGDVFSITAVEGQKYFVHISRVKFWRDE